MDKEKVIIKRTADMPWEPDDVWYALTASGLFINRNNEWFTSSAPAKTGPGDLADHEPFIQVRYPKLAQAKFEQVVGFFDWASHKHGEAAVLIVHHKESGTTDVMVPSQTCSWGSVEYSVPVLAEGWRVIGDIHSHVRMAAYSSYTDKSDEEHRPGLHIVVGKIDLDPPDFHVEVVADGHRFIVKDIRLVLEGYQHRARFPQQWKEKLKIKKWKPFSTWWKSDSYHGRAREDRGYRAGDWGRQWSE